MSEVLHRPSVCVHRWRRSEPGVQLQIKRRCATIGATAGVGVKTIVFVVSIHENSKTEMTATVLAFKETNQKTQEVKMNAITITVFNTSITTNTSIRTLFCLVDFNLVCFDFYPIYMIKLFMGW